MRERVEAVGGSLVTAVTGSEFVVTVAIPVGTS